MRDFTLTEEGGLQRTMTRLLNAGMRDLSSVQNLTMGNTAVTNRLFVLLVYGASFWVDEGRD